MKSKRTFDDLLKNVSKEEFEEFYFNHSKKETMAYYNIGSTIWYKYLNYYNIVKPKANINLVRETTNMNKYGVANQFQRVEYIQEAYINKDGSLEEHYKKSSEILKQKNLDKYGVECTLALPEVRNKINISIQKHIDKDPDYYKNISDKCKITKLKNHGDPNYNNIEQIKATNLEKYAVTCNFASKDPKLNGRAKQLEIWGHDNFNNREQAKQTCIDKFGKDYYINQVTLMLKALETMNKSKPNKEFAAYLTSYGIPFETEFPINNFIYDFKLGKYLIDVNPWATHSSSFAPSNWEPKSEDYHRNKTLNALENDFICIQLFDWLDINGILYGIVNKSLKLVDTYKPVRHIYDTKLKQLTNIENTDTVIIYDDGFEIIY